MNLGGDLEKKKIEKSSTEIYVLCSFTQQHAVEVVVQWIWRDLEMKMIGNFNYSTLAPSTQYFKTGPRGVPRIYVVTKSERQI